jgi:hypothetical protein
MIAIFKYQSVNITDAIAIIDQNSSLENKLQ